MDYSVKCVGRLSAAKKLQVKVPGSKSITARALLLASLAEGASTLYGVQFSDDCRTFIEAVKSLGIQVEENGSTVTVQGCGGRLPKRRGSVYVGSAGTAARFITAMLAFCGGDFEVTASEQMKKRPQDGLIAALEGIGASFEFLEKENAFPFILHSDGAKVDGVTVDISKSSQFLSAVLMSAPAAGRAFTVNAVGCHGLDYVKMTLDMMWSFGVNVREEDGKYVVDGKLTGKRYDVEPDVSAACYFYAAGRLTGADISVSGVMPHTMQGDYKFIKLIKDFDGGRVDMSAFSDQALTLAAMAPYFSRPTEICNVAHIRGQECDRINAICANLQAMGVRVEEFPDGVKIYPSKPKPARLSSFGDHRVAMSFALTGLLAEGIVIENAEVCSKTFKDYFDCLDGVIEELSK